jgi:antitoxin component HigA of HigAB toxin-antitoxin module
MLEEKAQVKAEPPKPKDPMGDIMAQINKLTSSTNKGTKKIASGKAGTKTAVDTLSNTMDAITKIIEALGTSMASGGSGGGGAAGAGGGRSVVGTGTVRKTGGIVQTVQYWSDGTQTVLSEEKDFGARDSVMKMFENTGLGQTFIQSLMDTIDTVYNENIMPTEAQVLNSIYNSDAYKTRFAANEAIRKRMADGKGMPGDKLLSPYEYIQTENQYRTIMQEASLPTGFYDQQEDFTKFIENNMSPAELTERVNIAKQALQSADTQIIKSLQDYYGLSTGDLTAYMLDKDKAFNLIDSRMKYTTEEAKKMYTSAEIGGAALRAGTMAGKGFAEEIYTAGKASQAEQAFQGVGRDQENYQRLMQLYGDTAGQEDLAREALALAGGTDVTLKKKRLASKERAQFSQKSAVDTTSLGRRTKLADI